MNDFLLEDCMLPMGLTAKDLSEGTSILLEDTTAMLADVLEVTPELSEKLGAYFGVSAMLFYDIQQDLKARAGVREVAYAGYEATKLPPEPKEVVRVTEALRGGYSVKS